MAKRTCSLDGCERKHYGRGWCKLHYERVKRTGSPAEWRKSPAERFWAKVDRRVPDECWPWRGALNGMGYGALNVDGKNVRAHRFAYVLLVGPIPDGLHLDHTCHSQDPTCDKSDACPHRRCVNPAHLEPVTLAENNKRGRGHGTETHCPHGHSYADAIRKKDGSRVCRECVRIRNRRRYLRAKQAR